MKNIYLSIFIVCVVFILIVGFQNIIFGQSGYALTFLVSNGVLIFMSAIVGAVGGAAFVMYYNTRVAENSQDTEDGIE